MNSAGVDVQFRRDPRPSQGEIHEYAVLRRADEVRVAVREKDGGCTFRNAKSRRQFVLLFCLQVAWIDRDREVGPATEFVHVIDRLVGSFVEARRRGHGEAEKPTIPMRPG